MPSKKFTPTINPEVFLNSGSKQFTAQQASIYKILFFNQQNELEYSQYLISNPIIPPINVPNTPFPVQEKVAHPPFQFTAGGV
jgi:hypothetical protein